MSLLAGKTVLITGAAMGLGRAVAILAAAEGAKVAVLDIDAGRARDTAEIVGGAHWQIDVADPDAWSRTANEIERRFGPVHYAHLNAGIMTFPLGGDMERARVENVSPARYRQVVSVNVDGVFFGLQTLLPRMKSAGGEAITVTSSAAGLTPIPFDPIYGLTKHAVVGLVRSVAMAEADGPVRINAICPGGFSSQLLPAAFMTPKTMTPTDMAHEVIDLLLRGSTGEVRLKLRGDAEATDVPPPLTSMR